MKCTARKTFQLRGLLSPGNLRLIGVESPNDA